MSRLVSPSVRPAAMQPGKSGTCVHLPTKEYFVFGDEDGGTHGTVPGYPGVVQNPFSSAGWDSKIPLFRQWLRSLRELLDAIAEYRSTPDLWSSIRSEKPVFQRFAAPELQNQPFTVDEQKFIGVQLQELRAFIVRTSQTQESNLTQIEARLRYLEEASTRMGRKDWLGILIAVVFTIVVSGLFAPDRANELLGFAAALFQSLYDFVWQLPPA